MNLSAVLTTVTLHLAMTVAAGSSMPSPAVIRPNGRQAGVQQMRADGRSDFTGDLKYVGTTLYMTGYMVSWAMGALLMANIVSMFYFLGVAPQAPNDRRSAREGGLFGAGPTQLWNELSQIRDTWQNFDVNNSECRQRFVCEAYVAEPHLGFFPKSLMTVIDYSLRAGMYVFPDVTREMFAEYDESKRAARESGNCTRFDGCSSSFVPLDLMAEERPNDDDDAPPPQQHTNHADQQLGGDSVDIDAEFGSGASGSTAEHEIVTEHEIYPLEDI